MNPLLDAIAADARDIVSKIDCTGLRGKTVLITGASGLIGVNVLACLRELAQTFRNECSVVATMQSAPADFIEALCDFPACTVIRGDLTDQSFYESLPRAHIIIHAAGYGQPALFTQNPVKTLQLNTQSTFALFSKLLPSGRFLFLSTSELYSGCTSPPFVESQIGSTDVSHPRACYIEGKRCGEAIVNAYRSQGVAAKSARLCLAYGPGTRPGDKRVLNSFIQRALAGQIDMLDSGSARRTYCYVADAVELLWKILLFGTDCVYNVGGESDVTILELARKIGGYLHVPVNAPPTPPFLTDAPQDVRLDMSKTNREFGKTAGVPFDVGLARTIEWQKILYGETLP
jgi:nucleoside-diphosphate-sugar epimerase